MVSYSVSRCVHEIGIRMALGADRTEVMKLVLKQTMRPVLIGGRGRVCCYVPCAFQHAFRSQYARPHSIHFCSSIAADCGPSRQLHSDA
jgi:hypothetical protein